MTDPGSPAGKWTWATAIVLGPLVGTLTRERAATATDTPLAGSSQSRPEVEMTQRFASGPFRTRDATTSAAAISTAFLKMY